MAAHAGVNGSGTSGGDIDTVHSSLASYTLPAGVENLILDAGALNGTGSSGVNTITGNAGANVLDSGGGADALTGGGGDDTYIVQDSGATITEAAGGGTDKVQSAVSFSLAAFANVENLTLTGSADINGTGNSGVNTITGNSGANRLDGGGGADTLIGGGGNDTYVIANAGVTITEGSGGGNDTVESSITFSIAALANVENVTLTGAANIDATGNGGDNVLTGNSGANTLNGGAGADVMHGGTGSDTYYVDNSGDVVDEAASPAGLSGRAVLDWRNTSTGTIELWGMDGATRTLVATPSVGALTTDWKLVGDADFSGDGKADLLWHNTVSGQNQAWFMDGTIVTGTANLSLVAAPDWQIVGTGNFNGDNQTDILWRNQATGDNAVWYMNGTTYQGGAYLSYANVATNWQIVGTGTFNGDASSDILWRNMTDGTTLVWFMSGNTVANYAYLSTPVVPLNMAVVATADFTGDGKADIVWRDTTTGTAELWTMDGATRTGVQALSVQNTDPSWSPFAAHSGVTGGGTTGGVGDVDTLHSSLPSYTLPTGVENLILDPGALNGTGNSAANRITGNSLGNILTGGGGDDIFAFLDAAGSDRIADFNAAGQGSDKIDLSGRSTHLTFADLIANHAANSGGDAVLTLDGQSSITIVGKLVGDLQASQFIL
jgi:hypothetical protein